MSARHSPVGGRAESFVHALMPSIQSPAGRGLVCLALLALSLLVHYRSTGYELLTFDDTEYVSRNPHVQNGLNVDDATWALTTTHFGNWHPIVWWSFQFDSHLFANSPFGFHFTNVVLHSLTVVLLFLALTALGLRVELSAVVAALFCVHPLNVESVAWVSERKGILSTFFWMLGLLAYARYVRRPGWSSMAGVTLCMAAGLMSKPSLVTFPFALLLLDVWPLDRLRLQTARLPDGHPQRIEGVDAPADSDRTKSPSSLGRCTIEKVPLFMLSLAFCYIAIVTQDQTGAVASIESVSISQRLLRIPCVYVLYLWKFFVPFNLSTANVAPTSGISIGVGLVAGLCLLAITSFVVRRFRSLPFLLVGWCWFLGTMFPTSGVIPIGLQWMADRYMSVPIVGLLLMVCGSFAAAAVRLRWSRGAVVSLFVAATTILSVLAFRQSGHWRDSEALLRRILAVDPDNFVAHSDLAGLAVGRADYETGLEHARQAIAAGPASHRTRNNYALCLAKLGETGRAETEFRNVIASDPTFAEAHLNLGNLLHRTKPEEAERHYREAIRAEPNYAEAYNNLGGLLAGKNPLEAREHFQTSLRLWPENADAHANLGNSFARSGDFDQAISHYRAAIEIDPQHQIAVRNLQVVTQMKAQARQTP